MRPCEKSGAHETIIKSLGITHIVNVTGDIPNKFQRKPKESSSENADIDQKTEEFEASLECEYLQIDIEDSMRSQVTPYFQEVIQFISKAISNKKNRVLVHCAAGVSRSSTMVMAYLMAEKKMNLFVQFFFCIFECGLHAVCTYYRMHMAMWLR